MDDEEVEMNDQEGEQAPEGNYMSNRRGRKRTIIGYDIARQESFHNQVTLMRTLAFKWEQISVELNVNVKFLSRWRKEVEFQDPLRSNISDAQLDEKVAKHTRGYESRGEKMLDGCLAVDDCRVSRKRLRESMRRVDPEGVEMRKGKAIHRRLYQVDGPHHLWHVDGNHKLTKFNMVVHAGIDGFSRALLYARCSDNNKKETAFEHFLEGVRKYGCPSRVRTDKGGENYDIARYMVETKGMNRGSILTGKSTHNQRIERQWRDMSKEVIFKYREMFFELDEICLRDYNTSVTEELPLFCLHFLFLRRINADLQRYMDRWNIHRIRTENNKCPARLLVENAHNSAAIEVDNYGIQNEELDIDGEFYDRLELPLAVVDSITNPFDQVQYNMLATNFAPFTLGDEEGMMKEKFIEAFLFARDL